ncbi:MAG: hypothetical protein A3K09_08700 [Nitrospinae bacterium RIFCSPLOWO2_12_FULL_47_7]|nr:MAG: hypothetical protein A3K09_08700 [Nitrospinae bacterium RIFCSPLOWO2_12_FULL_47_7]
MRKIRVLIADDEVLIRRMISEVLEEEGLQVAGIAANSSLALAKIPQVNPDLILLDLEFDGLTGLQTLIDIRKTYPVLPVIMLGSMKEKTVNLAMEALALGAHDYVTLPSSASGNTAKNSLRQNLIPKVKTFCKYGNLDEAPAASIKKNRSNAFSTSISTPVRAKPPKIKTTKPQRIDILAIGVSTGGPNALAQLLPELPKDFPVPIVIVQHMPPYFTTLLAKRLDEKSAIGVREAATGDILKPGQALLAPGDFHMVVKRNGGQAYIQTNQAPPENSCRPAVDVLFRSVVEVYGANTLAVILTGMGQDGLRGCEMVYDANGQILVQDEKSSVVWGMPGFVSKAGLADRVLPLNQIGIEITKKAREGRTEFVSA